MASPVELTVDFQQVIENTLVVGQRIEKNLADSLTFISGAVADRIRQNLSGGVLNIRSGSLFGSVKRSGPDADGSALEAGVTAGGDGAPYGIYFEKGGLGSYTITAKNAKVLAFMGGGGAMVFAKSVIHPAIPLRPWFQPAVDAIAPTIPGELQEAISEALND